MSTHFVKIYGTILHSSVWLEDTSTRVVWITMLALADADGVVRASVGGLAHAARVSREACQAALARFSAPDPDSRDGTTGERIEAIEGEGWRIINKARYRDMRTPSQIKAAERQARWRARQKAGEQVTPVTQQDATVDEVTAETETETETETEIETDLNKDIRQSFACGDPLRGGHCAGRGCV